MDNITAYFNGEKLQCLIGASVSVVVIGVSIYFLFLQKPFLKGMAYSLITFSILLLTICVAVIIRAPKDTQRVTTFYEASPEKIKTEELPRMEKVIRNFEIIKKVEIVVFLIGLILAIVFWRDELIRGIAAGLIVGGGLLYTFDYFAALRGDGYFQFLSSLQ